MDKEELAAELEKVMGNVPVCEGLIFANIDGEVIIGQTITEMDHGQIAKKAGEMLKIEIEEAQKGQITDLTIGMVEGSLIAVRKKDKILLGLLGDDGRSSMGLLRRQLKNIMK